MGRQESDLTPSMMLVSGQTKLVTTRCHVTPERLFTPQEPLKQRGAPGLESTRRNGASVTTGHM